MLALFLRVRLQYTALWRDRGGGYRTVLSVSPLGACSPSPRGLWFLLSIHNIRAASVAAKYEFLVRGADLAYSGIPRDWDGDVLALLRSLPSVTALAVEALGEWSREVDQFIADLGVKGSANPARFGCCNGTDQARGVISQHAAKCLGRVALRGVARVRHEALKAVTAGDSSRAFHGAAAADFDGAGSAWDPGTQGRAPSPF